MLTSLNRGGHHVDFAPNLVRVERIKWRCDLVENNEVVKVVSRFLPLREAVGPRLGKIAAMAVKS